jgi:hypothetical protein
MEKVKKEQCLPYEKQGQRGLCASQITEIYGAQDSLPDVQHILGCQIAQFSIRYLGQPLSTTKIPKAAI